MSIPYNDHLSWNTFKDTPDWHKNLETPSKVEENQVHRALNELFAQSISQPVIRGVQFVRDAARLVLKVPIRSTLTPIFLKKNWKQRNRALINAKLTGYSFVQLLSVPAKFLVALAAIATSAVSQEKAKWLLDKSRDWTAHLDGRASQLEALKEVGVKSSTSKEEFEAYKTWLYGIDPKLCRKV